MIFSIKNGRIGLVNPCNCFFFIILMKKTEVFFGIMLFFLFSFLSGVTGGIVSQEFFQPLFSSVLERGEVRKTSSENRGVSATITREFFVENEVIDIAENLKNSVVSIVVTKELAYVMRDPFSFFFDDPFSGQPEVRKEKRQTGAGTGFIISKEGLILTNKHVVSDINSEYTVLFADGREYLAEVITRDPSNDIAVVKIKNTTDEVFAPVSFVEKQEEIKVGQGVVAIGNALGQFQNTVTFGVISALGRSITASDGSGGSENLNQLLQTDASINPGNSGGPLVSLSGKVLGITTAVAGGAQGIGFAIPLDRFWMEKTLNQIQIYGKIVRSFLGVRYQIITPKMNQDLNLGSDFGAWLRDQENIPAVIPGTPAEKAGLRGGDIVLQVGDMKITEKMGLAELLALSVPGEEVSLLILREGKQKTISVILEERKEES